MKLIKPYTEIIEQAPGLDGLYKHIELIGRVSYKSENNITKYSAKEFVDRMIKLGHGAVLEHGTIYLTIPGEHEPDEWGRTCPFINYKGDYRYNKYSKVVFEYYKQEPIGTQAEFCKSISRSRMHITTNLRVLVENGWMDDLQYICEPTEYHEKRISVRFVADAGVMREFFRHRVFSMMQESTRYCNYSKNKFGRELTFILPPWMDEKWLGHHNTANILCRIPKMRASKTESAENFFMSLLANAEEAYNYLIDMERKPQEARGVLPLAIKSEGIMTGFVSDWKHFFDLRTAGSAHPQAQELAIPLQEEFVKLGWI